MAIQKYQSSFSGTHPSSFSSMLDRFFHDSLASQGRLSSFSPQVDAYETEQGFEIEAALPGLKRDDIKVDFHQGRLSISGEREFRNEENKRKYHLVESSYGSFYRSFDLPDTIDPSRIDASFADGVLHVHVPKDEKKTMRHQIEVRAGQSAAAETGKKPTETASRSTTTIPVTEATGASHATNGKH